MVPPMEGRSRREKTMLIRLVRTDGEKDVARSGGTSRKPRGLQDSGDGRKPPGADIGRAQIGRDAETRRAGRLNLATHRLKAQTPGCAMNDQQEQEAEDDEAPARGGEA